MNLPTVFMIGWEFPPHNSGGLGTACQGLTNALADNDIPQIFVLPKPLPVQTPFLEIVYPERPLITQVHVNLRLYPYGTIDSTDEITLSKAHMRMINSMEDEAYEYADMIGSLAGMYNHDVIHAHDWMTYPASFAAQAVSKKPVALHVHSTEFDRTLHGYTNPEITKIEAEGLKKADQVITVSNYTKNIVCERYGIPDRKVTVIHNGVDLTQQRMYSISDEEIKLFARGKKVIIFVGRLTGQKGPDYFVRIASKIASKVPEALFVVAGNGDMYQQIIMQSAGHNLTGKLLFSGFLRNRQRELLYRRADLFIMPSVSEPFGIVALEAAAALTPIIISNQSGVREVMPHALTADFWDVNKIANQAINVLKKPALWRQLADKGANEVERITWDKAARKCIGVYTSLVG